MSADRGLIEAVRRELAALADPAKAPGMQAYMKSTMAFYGVQKPGRAQVVRSVLDGFPLVRQEDWRETVLALWHEAGFREERYIAQALLTAPRYAPFRGPAALSLYEELIVSGAWWDYVDPIATRPLGALLPEVASSLRAWSVDADMWKRRSAIIAQVLRRGETDVALLCELIEPNRADREFFIRKAIGWALRAYAWHDVEAVVAYCDSHELAPLSRREALKNVAKLRSVE